MVNRITLIVVIYHFRKIRNMPISVHQSSNLILFGNSRLVIARMLLPHQLSTLSIDASSIDRIFLLAKCCTTGGTDTAKCRTQQEEQAEFVHGRFLWIE
jgi:hypothetical protein